MWNPSPTLTTSTHYAFMCPHRHAESWDISDERKNWIPDAGDSDEVSPSDGRCEVIPVEGLPKPITLTGKRTPKERRKNAFTSCKQGESGWCSGEVWGGPRREPYLRKAWVLIPEKSFSKIFPPSHHLIDRQRRFPDHCWWLVQVYYLTLIYIK